MKPLYLFFILTSCISLSAQNIKGVIYNSTSTIKDIKVENLTNYNSVLSNNKGEFTIIAKANDTLQVSSLFYITQKIIVKPIYETEIFVIQLKKTKNTLDEVKINGTGKEKIADIKEVQSNLRNQILEDIKRNPHLYGKAPNGNLDFIKIIGLIGKLFKKKNKDNPFAPISYQNLSTLFNNTHPLFNNSLLTETLKIEKDKKFLFFEFLVAKNIDSNLLAKDKELELLENIINASEEFSKIIDNFNKNKSD